MSNDYSIAAHLGYSVDQTATMRWPLTGRDRELGLVDKALSDSTVSGVVIAGPAGVGKTRLTTEAAELARAQGCAVEWVRCSGSARSIPLGAFAPLLPATELREGVELLAATRHALAERSAGRRLVLCIDDGQLLDDASAALVHQVVAADEAFVLVSVRRGEPTPDALRALWKDDLCALVDLAELSRREVEELLEAALGAPMDGGSATALWELTRGNALFLRELVRHGVDHGLLTKQHGVWRWRGQVAAGTRLAELVDLRIEEVGARERPVLELVAVAAPLEVGLLEPGELAPLEALERAELVQRRTDGRRRFVDVAHPLHGEAVRAQLTHTRVEALYTRLADAVEARGARRSGDLLRVAVWRLEAGAAVDAGQFARAAERALSIPDAELAERLARAAVQAGGDFGARLTLGRSLAGAGRAEEAQRVLAELATEAADDTQRAAVALASARNLFWALDQADEADRVLRDAEQLVADAALRHELVAQRVRLTAAQGRPRAALAATQPLLEDGSVDARARTTVALGAVEGLFSMGRTDEALALVEASLPLARRHRDELPHAEVVLEGMRAIAQRIAGRLVKATELSEDAYARLLRGRSALGVAVEANSLGLIWLARGRVRTALRFCREGAALLRDRDGVGMLAFALAGVTQAAAQAGEAELARDALEEMERTPLGHKGFQVELELARAWGAAASGELSRARELAGTASALAESREQQGYAARALHELCRLGDAPSAAPKLAGLAASVDGPFVSAAAAHAAALMAGDGAALLEAAERFAAQDALLVAAEAAHAAAAAHREDGRHASARAAKARAALWLTSCEGAHPPTMLAAPEAIDLTQREREIALLAAGGATSREVAERLVISVRTVDNHLQNAYRKLGVSRRQDLSRALEGTPAGQSRRRRLQ
jgi:DNA-binding CsgD family transcriptional regulator